MGTQQGEVDTSAARLTGKAVLVTGGGRGIGRAIALRLASEGAAVAVADVNSELAEQTVDKVASLGGSAVALRVDVTNRQQVREMVQRAVSVLGGLDGITSIIRGEAWSLVSGQPANN